MLHVNIDLVIYSIIKLELISCVAYQSDTRFMKSHDFSNYFSMNYVVNIIYFFCTPMRVKN